MLGAVIGFLLCGCASQEDQMTEVEARAEIGEELRELWEETVGRAILEEEDSSPVETIIFIGTNAPYKAESEGPPIWIE